MPDHTACSRGVAFYDTYRTLLNEICKSSGFLKYDFLFMLFGIESEKLGLEVGNGLPSWKFNDQLFPCDVCGKVFGRQQTLSRHLLLHTGKLMFCGWLLQH